MRVALAVNGFPVLSETFIYNQAAQLRARGIDVKIVAARGHGDPDAFAGATPFDGNVVRALIDPSVIRTFARTARRLTAARGRELEIAMRARGHYGNSARALRAWILALPLCAYDIVHLEYSGLAVAWLDALPLIAPTKIVVSCRGTAERVTPLVDRDRPSKLQKLFQIADRVHCVSRSMVETCTRYGLDPDKAFVNHPAIDTQRFARSQKYVSRQRGPYRLISTGRLHWAKGLEFGLLAVRDLIARGADVIYEIIGKGPDEDRIRYAIYDLGLEQRVVMHGALPADALRAALETADVYLLPSVTEGVSNAALEAMAMEIPVVTTSAGGMSEAITDGRDGLVVETRAPGAMADAVSRLLAEPQLRQELGRRGRERVVAAFTIERQTETFVAEYEALLRAT